MSLDKIKNPLIEYLETPSLQQIDKVETKYSGISEYYMNLLSNPLFKNIKQEEIIQAIKENSSWLYQGTMTNIPKNLIYFIGLKNFQNFELYQYFDHDNIFKEINIKYYLYNYLVTEKINCSDNNTVFHIMYIRQYLGFSTIKEICLKEYKSNSQKYKNCNIQKVLTLSDVIPLVSIENLFDNVEDEIVLSKITNYLTRENLPVFFNNLNKISFKEYKQEELFKNLWIKYVANFPLDNNEEIAERVKKQYLEYLLT